jgi:hypothetical protein
MIDQTHVRTSTYTKLNDILYGIAISAPFLALGLAIALT